MLFPCLPEFYAQCRELERNKDIKYTKRINGSYNKVYFDFEHSLVSRVTDLESDPCLVFASIKDWFCNQRILENFFLIADKKNAPLTYFAMGIPSGKSDQHIHFFSDEILEPMTRVFVDVDVDKKQEYRTRFIEKFMPKFLSTLDFLHYDLNLVHNDIKHDNILIRWRNKNIDEMDFDIVLIDFGLAFCRTRNIQLPSYLRAAKFIAPPEIVRRQYLQVIDTTIDTYAFGALVLNQFTDFSMYEKKEKEKKQENAKQLTYEEFVDNFFDETKPKNFYNLVREHVPFQTFVSLAMHQDPRERTRVTLREKENKQEKEHARVKIEKSLYMGPWWNFLEHTTELWRVLLPIFFIDLKIYVHPLVVFLTIFMFAQMEEYPYHLRDIESCFYIALAIYNNDLRILDLKPSMFNRQNVAEIMILLNRFMHIISSLEHANPIRHVYESFSFHDQNNTLDYQLLYHPKFLVLCFLYQANPVMEICDLFEKTIVIEGMKKRIESLKRDELPVEWQALLDLPDFQNQMKKILASSYAF